MRTSILAGTLLAGLALIGSPLTAQQVSAEVAVRDGRVLVTKRHIPRVIVVERMRHHHRKYWKSRAYRPVVIYYFDGRYYDWLDRRHPRVREVVVYEHHGRYYRDDRSYDRDD
jgi:hypothetical protein